jgi:arabinofuranosyltransferase
VNAVPLLARHWRWPVLALLLAAMLVGAHWLAFLCDDAFITFRYVANAHDGHGLVWNRAPFAPVEGYTGFLWALLLWIAWSWFGAEPPAIANALSIACGVLQFAVLATAALRLRTRDGERAGDVVGLAALAVIVANRSFLQWLTGGLETALFNLGFVAWVVLAFVRSPTTRWLAAWAAAAAIAALTRPDGLLLVATTLAVALAIAWRRRLAPGAVLAGLLPLAAVAVHVLWRRCYYGDWLPNTYYAKVVDPWPEAGLRYAACFALEHGTWFVAGLALVWIAVEHVRRADFVARIAREHTAALAAVGACAVHAGYYVFRVGGDHFEYRVFSQWVPLLVLATAAIGLRLANGARAALLALLALLVASSAGWVHYALTRDMPKHGFQRLAPRMPTLLQPLVRWYDRQQAWLLFQDVGVRCEHHARLLRETFQALMPHRMHIENPPDPFPVFAADGVGVVGWSLPDCAIIDQHGLNDWVIARTPVHGSGPALTREFLEPFIDAADANKDGWFDEDEIRKALGQLGGGDGRNDPGDYFVAILLAVFAHERFDAMTREEATHISDLLLRARAMAHEHHPPPGYVEAFEPNVVVDRGVARARPRAQPMTAERIRAIEAEWRERARTGTLPK